MARFDLFRYQILPVDRYFQGDLVSGFNTVKQLLENKNQIFADAIRQAKGFESSRSRTVTKVLLDVENFFLFRIAANRSIHRETREFRDEILDNWPSILVAIWNDPEVQIIAVQRRTTAFASTESVIRLIAGSISDSMDHHQLRVHSEPLFEKKVFWDLIDQFEGKINSLQFEFVTPNMANISGNLSESFKNFAKQTNSSSNKLQIESDRDSALNIDSENETLSGLVDYSSEGGGNISISVAGIRQKFHTSKSIKHVEIDDIQMEGASAEEIKLILEGLLE